MQLLSQRAQWEQEIAALRMKLQQAHDRDTPADPEINVPVPSKPTVYCSLYFVQLSLFASLCMCMKELMEQVAVREQECVRLRRELKELKHTVTLRRILSYAGLCGSKECLNRFHFFFLSVT